SHNDSWRFEILVEIENLLSEALSFDRDTHDGYQMITKVRRLLIEFAIKTLDLNLAAIYLKKLETGKYVEPAEVTQLMQDVDAARVEADPARNPQSRRIRKWAIIGCWLPSLWMGLSLVFAFKSSNEIGLFVIWVCTTSVLLIIFHFSTAIFAV